MRIATPGWGAAAATSQRSPSAAVLPIEPRLELSSFSARKPSLTIGERISVMDNYFDPEVGDDRSG